MTGTVLTFESNSTTPFGNTGAGYMSRTDNGFYLVKFTYSSETYVIAVRSALEILSEAPKAILPNTANTDINTLYTHASALITAYGSNASLIPLEDAIDTA